jgi:hypothetical protein
MGENFPIPITDGIDQRASSVVGQFRIQRLERARYLQPGEVIVSPGYAYDSGAIAPTNSTLRAIGYAPRFGCWAIYSGLLANGYYGASVARKGHTGAWSLDETCAVSPVEAPRRIRIDTNDASVTTPAPIAQILPTPDASLAIVVTNGSTLSYLFNGQVTKSLAFPGLSGDDGSMLRAAGRVLFDRVGSLWSYDLTSDTFARHLSLSGTFDYILGAFASMDFGKAGSTGYAATVHTTGKIRVYSWSGSAFALVGTIAAGGLPAVIANIEDISVSFTGSFLIRCCINKTVSTRSVNLRTYSLPALVPGTEFTYAPTSPDSTAAECSTCFDASGTAWLALYERQSHVAQTSVFTVTVVAGDITAIVSASTIIERRFVGVMFAAPATHGVMLLVSCGGLELWCVDKHSTGTTNGTGTATLCTSWGFGESTASTSQPVLIATLGQFDARQTEQLLFANFVTLNSVSKANEIVSVQHAQLYGATVPLARCGDTSTATAISPTESYCKAGDFVGGGAPFSIGTRLDTAGVTYTIPTPTLEAAVPGPHADTGSMAAGTYLYLLILDAFNSSGERMRSAPSLPVSITLTTETAVHLYFSKLPPMMPGLSGANSRWVVYRTLANGSVFYSCSQGSYSSNYSDVAFTDRNADSDIASHEILYTQGQVGGLSGQKANYGVPPCRCIWRGRDRLIVGGLEQPRRVRLSKLFFPGELVGFPHPAELAWTIDVDDDVMAVAQLDDAWLIGCAGSWYAVYGSGPDDTGANGQFDPPRCISRAVGCHSQRSICEIPEGLVFQAQNGIIYLIARGTLQIVLFSDKVWNLLTDISEGESLGWISAAVRHEQNNTIHFIRDTNVPLVYSTMNQSWSTDSDGISEGLNGAIAGCAARIPAAARTNANAANTYATVLIATASGKILFEGCDNGTDTQTTGPDGTVLWQPLLESNAMALWGLMGWGAINKVSLLFGAGYDAATFPLENEAHLTTWGGDSPYRESPSDTTVLRQTFLDAHDYFTNSEKVFSPRSAPCRLRLTWGGQKFVGFALDVEKKVGAERNLDSGRA